MVRAELRRDGLRPTDTGWRAHRVAWKPDRRLRAFADVPTELGAVPVAMRWELERRADPDAAGLAVEHWPHDRAWPHLAEVVDRPALAEILREHGHRGRSDPVVEVLRYRPRQRHVVRVGADGTEVYVKIGAAGTGARSAAAAMALARACRAAGAPAAEPGWWSDRLGTVAAAAVAGTVRSPACPPGADDLAHLARIGRFLRALHEQPVAPEAGPADDAAEEARLIRRAWEHVCRLSPALEPLLAEVLEQAVTAAGRPGRRVLLHGDLKLEHLLDTGTGLAIIDLDSVVAGDPHRDLGRLVASTWWATGTGSIAVAQRALLGGYGHGAALDEAVLGGWTALALLKQAARRVPVLEPRPAPHFERWLAAAAAAAGRAGR